MRRSKHWWDHSVIYQIYPKSFADSNGDGIGDLQGIIEHVDYISDLGVGAVWISPIYQSPMDDNGYDISNYCEIDPVFGTMEDFSSLVAALHERGIRIIMDMVFNHTSDEHQWFQDSKTSKSGPRRDWYWWRPGRVNVDGSSRPPNDWGSFFSGSAWTLDETTGEYYLHLFSPKQPDLNWAHTEVRQALAEVMRFWLDKGVDGFRMDVINYVAKDPALNAGAPMPSGFENPLPQVAFGPRIVDYLSELRDSAFAGREGDYLIVGETPGARPEQALSLLEGTQPAVDMVFQFEHMELDECGPRKWDLKEITAMEVARSLALWQDALGQEGWNSLYLANHDQPRPVSRFGDPAQYPYESATALATMLHLMRGTPFIFQGEEIGAVNPTIRSREDLRDIESINFFDQEVASGRSEAELLHILQRKARDNARSPMPWVNSENRGFSTADPWAPYGTETAEINVAEQRSTKASVLRYYKKLVSLRASSDVIAHGAFEQLTTGSEQVFAYLRTEGGEDILVLVNLASTVSRFSIEELAKRSGHRLLLANALRDVAPIFSATGSMQPWEAQVWVLRPKI